MTKRKIIKQIKAKVKAEIEWTDRDLLLTFSRDKIGDTITLCDSFYVSDLLEGDLHIYKKSIVMNLYGVTTLDNSTLGKTSLGKFSKDKLESTNDKIVDKLIEYIKECGTREKMIR